MVVLAIRQRLFQEMFQRVIRAHSSHSVIAPMQAGQLNGAIVNIEWQKVQWLITTLTLDGQIPGQIFELRLQYPSLSVLALSADGGHAKIQAAYSHGGFHQITVINMTLNLLLLLLQYQPTKPLPKTA